jgi:ataxin-10
LISACDEISSTNSGSSWLPHNQIRAIALTHSVDDFCLRILSSLKRKQNLIKEKMETEPIGAQQSEYWNEIIKSSLQLLMCLSHRSSLFQDSIRVRGGLPIVLAYCVTDFDNPLSREYALMTVRNLCEGNLENQRFIESLQPQKVIQDDLMKQKGIRVEIDPSSGKFHFRQVPKEE